MFRVFIIMAIELALPTREERWLILTNLSYVVGFKEGVKRRREKRAQTISTPVSGYEKADQRYFTWQKMPYR